MSKFQIYGKAILAFLYAVAVVAMPFYTGDRHIDPNEGVLIAIAVCTNGMVFLIPILPGARWTKTAVGAALAGLQIAATLITGGIDGNEALMIGAAILGALGITAAPAASPTVAARAVVR